MVQNVIDIHQWQHQHNKVFDPKIFGVLSSMSALPQHSTNYDMVNISAHQLQAFLSTGRGVLQNIYTRMQSKKYRMTNNCANPDFLCHAKHIVNNITEINKGNADHDRFFNIVKSTCSASATSSLTLPPPLTSKRLRLQCNGCIALNFVIALPTDVVELFAPRNVPVFFVHRHRLRLSMMQCQ